MEITNYKGFINEKFSNSIAENQLETNIKNDYILELKNQKVTIEFFTEYRVDNRIGIVIVEAESNKSYDLFDIPLKKGEKDPFAFMTLNENNIAISFNDPIKEFIYIAALIIEKYGSDIFN